MEENGIAGFYIAKHVAVLRFGLQYICLVGYAIYYLFVGTVFLINLKFKHRNHIKKVTLNKQPNRS